MRETFKEVFSSLKVIIRTLFLELKVLVASLLKKDK